MTNKTNASKAIVLPGFFIVNALTDQTLQNTSHGLKMERNPENMMVIEQTNRQMLAQAWLDRATTRKINKSSVQGVKQYYLTHPKLVAKYNTFKLKEILIGKVDVKGRDEAINKGVKGLFPVAV